LFETILTWDVTLNTKLIVFVYSEFETRMQPSALPRLGFSPKILGFSIASWVLGFFPEGLGFFLGFFKHWVFLGFFKFHQKIHLLKWFLA